MKKRYWIAILCAVLALVLTVAAASADEGDVYGLMTDANDLHDGDRIILVSDDGSNYQAMVTDFFGMQVIVEDNTITERNGMLALTLTETTGGWLLEANDGYLAADGGALTIVPDSADAAVWSISIASDGTATVSCTDGDIVFAEQDGAYLFFCGEGGNEIAIYNATFEPEHHAFGDGLWWSFANGKLTIGGSGVMSAFSPSSQPWNQHNSNITEVEIQNSVTSIGNYAFYNCTGLTQITIPDSVTSIGNYAFYSCTRLTFTSITIPDNVTHIGEYAFYRCTGLTEITIGNGVTNVGRDAFGNTGWWNAQGDGIVYLDYILLGIKGTGVQIVRIKDGTRVIADNAFYNNNQITKLTIPDSVTSISNYAFYNCTGLTEITIPDSVTSISNYAFYNCTGLTEITIPDSVTSISNYAFYNCTRLTFTSIMIPDNVTHIGEYAFYRCTGLTEITIPDSVTSIGKYAFYYCTGLTEITIGNGVTSTGESAFCNCTGLSEITIGNSVTSIGYEAFRGCTGLTEITIPDSVTSIGISAFSGCRELQSVTMPCSAGIDNEAFYNCTGITSVHLTKGTGIMTDYRYYSSTSSSYSYKVTPWYQSRENAITVTMDDGIQNIGSYAFYNCTGLTEITIPDSVTSIGDYAFSGCTGLTEIAIPDSVTNVGSSAFEGCTGLTEIAIPDSVTNVGSSAFYNCTGLTEITIPDSVTSIGEYAFYYCTGLSDVYYHGTRRMRNNITIGYYNEPLANAQWHYLTPNAIEWKTLPSKLQYQEGETLDVTGGVLTTYYDYDIVEEETLTAEIVTGFDGTRAGEQTLTVTFEDKTLTYTVTVSHVSGDATHENEVAPTCTQTGGYDEVVYCSGCGEELSRERVVLSALGHDLVHHDAQAATCTEIGWEAYDTCSRCDYTTYVELPKLGHDLVHHDARAATCTEIGWEAYDTCSRCDYTTYTELPALGHVPGEPVRENETMPTCTIPGEYDEVVYCSYCGEELSCEHVDVPSLGHNLVHHGAKGPTCTEIGWNAYDTCSRCDYTTYVELPALGHDLHHHDFQAATCTEIGWEAYDTCSRCDYTTYTELPALGHVPGEPVRENEVAPTYTTEGNFDEVVYCTRCGAEIERHTYKIDRLPFEGTLEWNAEDIAFIDCKPCVAADGTAKTPRFTVKDSDGYVVNPRYYDYEYTNNIEIGTALITVTLKDGFSGVLYGTFEILSPTEVVTQPKAQTVANGKTAKFTVATLGKGVKYQWYYSTNNGAKWTKWSGKTSASVSVAASAKTNGNLYRCEITKGDYSSTSKSAKLTVSGVKPRITAQPKKTTVAVGEVATFKVVAAGTGLKYQWYYSKDNGAKWVKWSGKTKASVKVTANAANNGTMYRCVVKNTKGSVTSSAVKMTVSGVKPRILTQPKAVTVAVGKTVKFTVAAAGVGLKYQWQYSKNGGKTWTKLSGKASATLSFKAAKKNNGWLYRCVVKNDIGSVNSKGVKLTVK